MSQAQCRGLVKFTDNSQFSRASESGNAEKVATRQTPSPSPTRQVGLRAIQCSHLRINVHCIARPRLSTDALATSWVHHSIASHLLATLGHSWPLPAANERVEMPQGPMPSPLFTSHQSTQPVKNVLPLHEAAVQQSRFIGATALRILPLATDMNLSSDRQTPKSAGTHQTSATGRPAGFFLDPDPHRLIRTRRP